MFLQRIEIQGFKSFANKTVLEFPATSNKDKNAKSIDAIVGPNGSGKSNIADAIRWVLGEQSVKLLRGKKNEDVIFAGSEKKARLGFAEVSLTLDNSDNQAPIDYNELVITRRVYRDGEGEYLINKNKVRLYDIFMLLAKANFGQKSYSIVGQGMVDQIINISPWERKEFFDEATGVKQYQIKRDQSVNRLNRSKENLDQTNKILAELEPRLRLLTRQVKKLEKRKVVEKELRGLQEKYYANIWKTYKRDQDRYQEEFSIKDALKKELDDKLLFVQTKLAEFAREESRKDIFNNLQKDYTKLQNEKNDLQKELAEIKGKMSLEYVKFGKQNLSWLEDKKAEISERLSEVNESLNNIRLKLDHKKEKLQEKQKKINNVIDELIVLQNNMRAAEQSLARIKSGRTSYAMEAVKSVLRQKDKIQGIYGTVGDLASADPMYETALAVAAGGRIMAVVVRDDVSALECINFLKENKLPPVTFLPLNKIKAYKINDSSRTILAETGAIAFAVDLLSFDQKFRRVYEHIFGSTIVVDKAEHAKNIGVSRERMVSLDGDIFEKTGVMKGGHRHKGETSWVGVEASKDMASQEEKMRELAILKSKIEDYTKQRENLSEEINSMKVELQVDETKEKGLANDLEKLDIEKSRVLREIDDNKMSPKDQDKFLQQLDQRKIEAETKIENFDKQIADLRKKIDTFNLEEERKKEEVFNLQKEMQEYQGKVNGVEQEINDIKIELAKLSTKKEDLEKEVSHELDKSLDKLNSNEVINTEQLWMEIGKLKQNLEMIGGIDPEIIDEHKEVSERYDFLSSQTNDLEKAIVDLEKIIEELDVVIKKQFNASFKTINKAFEHYFQKIFQGGKAKLNIVQKASKKDDDETMTEAEKELQSVEEEKTITKKQKVDLSQTGVEIYASPPTKKLINITAMSGGERTMTSLALLCAIIDSNPAPFVLMDEVDAALDEANSERFATMLQELSYKSQFVLITHNRVMMHVADVLYGVAMGDDGISKTLSLDLKEAEKQAK